MEEESDFVERSRVSTIGPLAPWVAPSLGTALGTREFEALELAKDTVDGGLRRPETDRAESVRDGDRRPAKRAGEGPDVSSITSSAFISTSSRRAAVNSRGSSTQTITTWRRWRKGHRAGTERTSSI